MTRSASIIENKIDSYFSGHYSTIGRTICFSKENGKTYEIYCVTKLLEWIENRYDVVITYHGKRKMKFRSKGGCVDRGKYPYFVIKDKRSGGVVELHTNIEVRTLGSSIRKNKKPDNSFMHEVDIVLIDKDVKCGDIPNHDQVYLGIECKEYAKLRKGVIREVLGVRRELSMLSRCQVISLDGVLTSKGTTYTVPANPSSLYWLACIDDCADRYRGSPYAFGIEIQEWIP